MDTPSWNPKTLLETSGYYWKTATLHTAVSMDIFTLIGETPQTAHQLCKEHHADHRGMETLLNALCAMGLLTKSKDLYQNTSESLQYLSKHSPEYCGFIIKHHHNLVDSWNRMSESVISGKSCRRRASHGSDEEMESFLMGMFNIASSMAPALAEQIDLSEKKKLLDFGGGPGTFAIHFCQTNPDLHATVFDLPTTRKFALKTIERFNLSHRINVVDGSFHDNSMPFENEYDVAWLSHVLHAEGPEEAERIVEHAAHSLSKGGLMLIHEFILDDTMTQPLFPALFSINMLVGTPNGRSYSEKQLISMMEKHGIKDIERLDYTGPTMSGILRGIKG